ncbi:MAG: very short patch repair endonuclease [Candidatus Brocadiaceae bacterium]|nr:very short patch repair endonuclease [Candidatus Brocadiaceae bacterium]
MEKRLKKYLKNGKFEDVSKVTSKTMAAIKSKSNRSTELILRMALIRRRISGFRLQAKDLPGNPDFVFIKEKIAIFVDGCYWHGCSKCGHIPKTRSAFWNAKIKRNKVRDKQKNRELKGIGIRPLRIWEHDLKGSNISKTISKIEEKLKT